MKRLILLLAIVVFSHKVFSEESIRIKNVSFNDISKKIGNIEIDYTGRMRGTPDLEVRDKLVQVSIPNSSVWPKIDKGVEDLNLTAYQYTKDTVRFRVMFPKSIKGKEGNVSLELHDGKIVLNIPNIKQGKKAVRSTFFKERNERKKTVTRKSKKAQVAGDFDESFLNTLLKDTKDSGRMKVGESQKEEVVSEEKIKMALSATDKSLNKKLANTSNSAVAGKSKALWEYAGRMVLFLIVILGIFYGVVHLMKRGMTRKSKLGFLNNSKLVEVLSTTYISPKKNVVLLKAHNQVFLIGSSENGIQLISEVTEVSELLKNGEKSVSGSNFDTNVSKAEAGEKDFKIKEIIDQSAVVDKVDIKKEIKEKKNMFADQLKKKVKGLKSLQ
jgi:flagellar biogenesis protein FliO